MASQPPPPLTTQTLARQSLDDLLRRELKISDPRDPLQIAAALRERYRADPRAQAIDGEARGLPYLQVSPAVAAPVAVATSVDAELAQARDDVTRDLAELCSNNLLKDVSAELRGWAQAITTLIDEGARSAPYALDSRQRDKVLAVRRQLGDYARLARLVGAYSPNTNALFRSLARSLDEAAAVLLVMLGEALANLGASGQFFLQVPLSELQIRREAALSALRNLTNATQASSLYQNDWQWGLNAYRKLFTALEQHGYGDLRALMLEDGLANAMDLMIQRAAKGSIEGLRALGATAQIDLERFHRLALVARQLKLRAPPLAAFIDAIMLFAEAFDVGNGQRLMRVARPPILFYGLYGLRGSSRAEVRLSQIVNLRGQLAEEADCLDQCECDTATRKLRVMLDKVLYDLDRAIDLYVLGKGDWGEPEIRAAAYGLMANALVEMINDVTNDLNKFVLRPFVTQLESVFITLCGLNPESKKDKILGGWKTSSDRQLVERELAIQHAREAGSNKYARLVESMSPGCTEEPLKVVGELIDKTINSFSGSLTELSTDPDIPDPTESAMADWNELQRLEIEDATGIDVGLRIPERFSVRGQVFASHGFSALLNAVGKAMSKPEHADQLRKVITESPKTSVHSGGGTTKAK